MKGYKLTGTHGRTFGGTSWGENVTHRVSGKGKEFCTSDLIHLYSDPLVALLHNPLHGNFHSPQLWEVEAEEPVHNDHGMKLGAKVVTTIRPVAVLEITLTMRVCYAILCAQQLNQPIHWREWAERWLSGEDRTAATASDTCLDPHAPSWTALAAGEATQAAYFAAQDSDHAHTIGYTASIAGAAAASNAIFAASKAGTTIDFPALAARAVAEESSRN